MSDPISIKRQVISIVMAWLIFIGLDFLFHASLFTSFWQEDLPALKSLSDLAVLIPAGYFSFLLLNALSGYVFFSIFKTKPDLKSVLKFSFIFAFLFAASNYFGMFSYINLPVKQLVVINLVYFIEFIAIFYVLYRVGFSEKLRKPVWLSVLTFFGLIFLGIVVQNLNNF